MSYIDGYLIPVPTHRRDAYREHEEKWWPYFRDAGAVSMTICWGDDIPIGKQTDFPRAVDLQADETVVFGWMVWPDKETRDKAYAKMMDDPDLSAMSDMPFDGKRLVYGGFVPLLIVGASQ